MIAAGAAGNVRAAMADLVIGLGVRPEEGPTDELRGKGNSVKICTLTPFPAVTGEFIGKDGRIRVHPDGRFEIVVEPRTTK
jgi:hypothetical protein